MGQVLSSPKKEITYNEGETKELTFVAASMQGWRRFMEDSISINVSFGLQNDMHYFSIFDGHNGGEIAKFCSLHLEHAIKEYYLYQDLSIEKSIMAAFMEMDKKLKSQGGQCELRQLAESDDQHPELDTKAEALGRFLIERAKRKYNQNTSQAFKYTRHTKETRSTSASEHPLQISPPTTTQNDGRKGFSLSQMLNAEPQDSPTSLILTKVEHSRTVPVCPTSNQSSSKPLKSSYHFNGGRTTGCTALVVFHSKNRLIIGNAGDSRCVLCRSGKAVDLTLDHKPEIGTERLRIYRAGGTIQNGRINGSLNVSRAIGDFDYKSNPSLPPDQQIVIAKPDVHAITILPTDEFFVIACDGIWECIDSLYLVKFIRHRLYNDHQQPKDIVKEVLYLCLSKTSTGHKNRGTGLDNMTLILVCFK